MNTSYRCIALQRRGNLLLLAGLFLAIMAFSGCKGKATDTGRKQIDVAALLPLTGPAGSTGVYTKQGFEMAAADIAKRYGMEVRFQFEDTQSNPKTAVTLFQRSIRDKAPDVLLVEQSFVVKAIQPLLEGKFLTVNILAAAPGLTDPARGLFRVFPTADVASEPAAKYAMRTGAKTSSIVHLSDDYGLACKQAFQREYEKLGGKILRAEPYNIMEKDFRTQWRRVLADSPECLWVIGYGPGFIAVHKQLLEMDYHGLIMSDVGLTVPEYLAAIGGPRDGTAVSVPRWREAFAERYAKTYNRAPYMLNVGYAYDLLMMSAMAYRNSQGSGRSMIHEFAATKGYEGAMGRISMLPSGEADINCEMHVFQSGRLVPVGSSD